MLGPYQTFLIDVNDLPNEVKSYLIMIADNEKKIMKETQSNRDVKIVQNETKTKCKSDTTNG